MSCSFRRKTLTLLFTAFISLLDTRIVNSSSFEDETGFSTGPKVSKAIFFRKCSHMLNSSVLSDVSRAQTDNLDLPWNLELRKCNFIMFQYWRRKQSTWRLSSGFPRIGNAIMPASVIFPTRSILVTSNKASRTNSNLEASPHSEQPRKYYAPFFQQVLGNSLGRD